MKLYIACVVKNTLFRITKRIISSLPYSAGFVNCCKKRSMDSQKAQYDAGQIAGQTREKAGNLIEKADKNAQYVKENVQEGGQQMLAKAQGAAEGTKDATGVNK